jgi:putative membrane protein
MGFGMLFMVLFWVFLVAAAVWLITMLAWSRGADCTGRDVTGSNALSILGERLARGEIDIEEFRARKAALAEGGDETAGGSGVSLTTG